VRVILVDMPFASVARPALGLSLLKASLAREHVECDVIYPCLAFARLVGLSGYERIATELPQTILAGEWVFTECLYGESGDPGAAFVVDVLRGRWQLPDEDVDLVLRARALASTLIEECLAVVPWGDYDLAGFTSAGAQNIAALALAQRVKAAHPGVIVAFGGSNWDEGMGAELHRRFDFVDVAFSGEADLSLPLFVAGLQGGATAHLDAIPGIVYREGGRTRATGPAAPVADLDDLPPPDHSDYFEALRANHLMKRVQPAALVETCRGCWWAARKACLFCGSPGCRRDYRAKSSGRVLAELRAAAAIPGCRTVEVVDDVPSAAFFDEVLPALAAEPLPVPLFCEVRPEVTREQIEQLAACAASIQPGIESLSDHVLRLMHKGSRALENVRLLLWCRTYGVPAAWNLIYGVPGETDEDYERMTALIPALRFLQPPGCCGPVRLDRFSTYAERPADYGLRELEPLDAYRYLYPFPRAPLMRIAYAFEYAYAPGAEPWARVRPLVEEVERWQAAPEGGAPLLAAGNGGPLRILDTRSDAAVAERRLDALESAVYLSCADIARRRDLEAMASARLPKGSVTSEKVDAILSSFVADRLMVKDGDRFLSLALPPGSAGGSRDEA
jgi:ribosomal peptide maturation radical SAM protein 1